MTADPVLPAESHLGRAALVVSELESMIEFYRAVVGLSVRSRTETSATLGTAARSLLVLKQDEDAHPRRRDQAGLFHIAFAVPTHAALGAALERIREHSRLDGASTHYVSDALYVRDPDGNGVEIYTDHPKDEWPRAADGAIQIGTAPLDLAEIAAQSDGAATAPPETTVGHVHLEPTSLETAREFYAETLGLRVQTALQSAVFLAAGDYHHHLGLNTWQDRSQPAGDRGIAWFEFVVPDAASLTTVRNRLEDAAITVTDRGDGIGFSDPDGISIRVRTNADPDSRTESEQQ